MRVHSCACATLEQTRVRTPTCARALACEALGHGSLGEYHDYHVCVRVGAYTRARGAWACTCCAVGRPRSDSHIQFSCKKSAGATPLPSVPTRLGRNGGPNFKSGWKPSEAGGNHQKQVRTRHGRTGEAQMKRVRSA
eukprot:6206055-Pleurochrysis_carterae.AAC.1